MFYSITGNILASDASGVAVDVNGVGFKCFATLNTLKRLGPAGSKVTLYTHLNVKDDALDLYGFYDEKELETFKLLITVSGVGPKAALSILSTMDPDELACAVASADVKSITRAQNVGPKLAQRVILELKGKLSLPDTDDAQNGAELFAGTSVQAEVVSALEFLGYSQSEASKALKQIDQKASVEEMIKSALAVLS